MAAAALLAPMEPRFLLSCPLAVTRLLRAWPVHVTLAAVILSVRFPAKQPAVTPVQSSGLDSRAARSVRSAVHSPRGWVVDLAQVSLPKSAAFCEASLKLA